MASVKTHYPAPVVPIWPFVACLGVIALVSGLNVAIGDPRTSGLDEVSPALTKLYIRSGKFAVTMGLIGAGVVVISTVVMLGFVRRWYLRRSIPEPRYEAPFVGIVLESQKYLASSKSSAVETPGGVLESGQPGLPVTEEIVLFATEEVPYEITDGAVTDKDHRPDGVVEDDQSVGHPVAE
jgi:hypothetical protein